VEGSLPDEEYVTVAQASQLSGLSRRQIQWLLKSRIIAGIKPGHDWLLRPSAVMEYLKQERKPGRKPRARQ
jgi:excisionase family DNA binding protein